MSIDTILLAERAHFVLQFLSQQLPPGAVLEDVFAAFQIITRAAAIDHSISQAQYRIAAELLFYVATQFPHIFHADILTAFLIAQNVPAAPSDISFGSLQADAERATVNHAVSPSTPSPFSRQLPAIPTSLVSNPFRSGNTATGSSRPASFLASKSAASIVQNDADEDTPMTEAPSLAPELGRASTQAITSSTTTPSAPSIFDSPRPASLGNTPRKNPFAGTAPQRAPENPFLKPFVR